MEASAIPATVGLARTRGVIGAPLLRLRSDEQLVSMFRSGNEEAFRAIHDRYRQRMYAYARQMLAGSAADAEDAVQEIFVRAYAGLRANHRELALRAWLYRIAHNRCIDELRRPQVFATDEMAAAVSGSSHDPVARLEQRDALRRLIADVQRLPDQQRSALLMRELAGMSYSDLAGALGISVPAVKSLLVRARVSLAQASEARDTACAVIREDLIIAHDRGVRTSGLARRHMRDCPSCRQFRSEVRGVSRQLAAFAPTLGPLGLLAKLLGVGGAGGGSAAAGSGAMAGGSAGSVAGGGAAITAAGVGAATSASAGHVVTILAAAVVTAGGAMELQHIVPPAAHHSHHAAAASSRSAVGPGAVQITPAAGGTTVSGTSQSGAAGAPTLAVRTRGTTGPGGPAGSAGAATTAQPAGAAARRVPASPSLSEVIDPESFVYSMAGGPAMTPTTPTGLTGDTAGAASGAPTAAVPPGTATSGSQTSSSSSSPSSTAGTPTSGSATSTGTGAPASSSSTAGSQTSPAAGSSTTGGGTSASSGSGSGSTTPAGSGGSTSTSTSRSSATTGSDSGTAAVMTMTGN